MNTAKNKYKHPGTGRILSVILMFLCLVFMTSLNYFLYPSPEQAVSGISINKSSNNIPPSGPTEEKSSSSGVSIIEEFLHDPHPVINFSIQRSPQMHCMAGADKVLVYHGELLSPPPEV